MSPWKALFSILFEPRRSLEALGERLPALPPYLVLVLGNALLAIPILGKVAEFTRQQMAATPTLPPAAVETAIKVQALLAPLAAAAGPLVTGVITAALLAFIGMFADGQASFGKLFALAGWASIPTLISGAIKTFLIYTSAARDLPYISTSLALLLPREQFGSVLYRALSVLDPFWIWSLVIYIVGLAYLNGWSIKKAAAVVISLALAWGAIGWALAGRAAGKLKMG